MKPSDCEYCGGSGWVHPMVNDKVDYSHVVVCSCTKKKNEVERLDRLLRVCNLPSFANDMTFEKFKVYPEVKLAFDSAKEMASNPKKLCWLAFIGTNGTGKTHLGVSVCRAWVKAGVPARYMLVSLLLDELRQGFSTDKGENSYEGRFKYYCNIPLLFLDDYGLQSSTPWVQEKLDTLIDYRLMNNLSLIVTSNNSLDEMPPRIRSRLMRHPNSKIIAIMAEDYVPKTRLSDKSKY